MLSYSFDELGLHAFCSLTPCLIQYYFMLSLIYMVGILLISVSCPEKKIVREQLQGY